MLGKRVLYYDRSAEDPVIGERAVLAAGFVPELLEDPEELAAVDVTSYDALVLAPGDEEAQSEEFAALLDRVEAAYPACRLVLALGRGSEPWLDWMGRWRCVRHLLARGAGARWATELRTTLVKLLDGEIFGLDRYLGFGVRQHQILVEDSRDKGRYVREVAELAARFEVVPRMVELVETVVDELSTNAIFNAPRDGAGQPRYAHLNRRDPVALEAAERAELRYACDGRFFAVAQKDPFGALTRQTVVSYLDRCLKKSPGELLPQTGGAGLGLYRVYRSISQLVVNVQPGVRTEVIGIIDLRHSVKQFKRSPKSLHFFEQETAP